MNEFIKKYELPLILVGICLVIAAAAQVISGNKLFGAASDTDIVRYNAIGTTSVPLTLNRSFTGGGAVSSSALLVRGMPNLAFAVGYLPKSQGSKAYLLLERSIDNGTTFFPYESLTVSSTEIQVNTNGTSTTNGTPFVFPKGLTDVSTSGTLIKADWDMTLVADYIKISLKEDTTSTAGTVYVQTMFSSN